ncbi:hypothetical protein BEP19_09440 [Ammoniphilus oxalaticus]|uniref:Phosphatidylglycerol lysyltransferase C-terminal domain-containing protein n=1 Tax=Ammoniphilus oxalaticus TaxID=66863 RepID=A0A419SKW6_9BACL|nr:phosphatidylglycerol lysyltransferase domain-containing protein [Ammoniphilus oxalaticus]RKD24590.1 hypothetical protein BEP19_09440 [Ammoniphilus oxalaticus]
MIKWGEQPRKIKLGDQTFRQIRLRDKEMFESYTKRCDYPTNLWSMNFAFLWADAKGDQKLVFWKIIDDLLVPFVLYRKEGLHLLCLPLGAGGPDRILYVAYQCLKFCNTWNRKNRYYPATIRTVNRDQLTFLQRSSEFQKYFEYREMNGRERHFSIEKITELKGKDFQRIRNQLNRFNRDYPNAVIRPYEHRDYEAVLRVNNNWLKKAKQQYSVIFDQLYFREIMKQHEELEHAILVVEIDHEIVGMVSAGLTAEGQSWGCLIKKMADVDGLNEVMIVEMARAVQRLYPTVELLNVGSDLGVEGLSKFKEKFRPALSLERYRVRLKK